MIVLLENIFNSLNKAVYTVPIRVETNTWSICILSQLHKYSNIKRVYCVIFLQLTTDLKVFQ